MASEFEFCKSFMSIVVGRSDGLTRIDQRSGWLEPGVMRRERCDEVGLSNQPVRHVDGVHLAAKHGCGCPVDEAFKAPFHFTSDSHDVDCMGSVQRVR